MISFKSYIYEASLLGRTTKYSGSLGAFKQYVTLSPKNKIFELEKDAELYQMDGTPMDETLKKGTKLEIIDREEKDIKIVGRGAKAIRVNLSDSKYRRYKGQDFLIKLNKILKPSGKNVEPMQVDLDDKINPNVFTNFKAGHGHEGQFTEAWIKGSGDNWQFDYKGKEYRIVELRAPNWRGPGNPKTDVTVVLDKKIPTLGDVLKYSLKSENATYFENWMLPERFLQIYNKPYASKLLNEALKELRDTGKIGGTKTNTHSLCPFIAKKWNFAPALNAAQMREVISGGVKFNDGEGAANVFYGGDVPKKPDMIQQILAGTKTAGEMSKKIKAGLSIRGSSDIKNSSCFLKGEDGKWYINDMKRNGWGDLFDIDKEFYRS